MKIFSEQMNIQAFSANNETIHLHLIIECFKMHSNGFIESHLIVEKQDCYLTSN